MQKLRIALLEDDPDQAELINTYLVEAGHHCVKFKAGMDLIRKLRSDSFDLLMIDRILPDMDGLDVMTWIRRNYDKAVPIIFVTVIGNEDEIVKALDGGADEYLVKPIRMRELEARINAMFRRVAYQTMEDRLEYTPYSIDRSTQRIEFGQQFMDLTQKEYELAVFMFNNEGRILSRKHILESVWGKSGDLNTRTVDTHMSRIRKKLTLGPENGWVLKSIYQHGYRLERY
ncbi:MAG: response regulator transcription factor [Thiotrichales bacterium]